MEIENSALNPFEKQISSLFPQGLPSVEIQTLQVNLGLLCNQRCRHCHLDASPERREAMDWSTMKLVVEAARICGCPMVDLTGGAPELNPLFRSFVRALRRGGREVQVRTNLTVLLEPLQKDLPEFFREYQIRLAASLPCYLEENVRSQRGEGVYAKSVAVLKKLNQLGYGLSPDLPLNLVFNPGGPFLPPSQAVLEEEYRRELDRRWGITFSRLLTLTNVPLGRFQRKLICQGEEETYRRLLRESFNPATLPGLMCRHQLSIRWDGTLYDCDFNLALDLPVDHGAPDHLRSFGSGKLETRRIVTGEHCFACTAGSGSSCRGALT